MWVRSQNKRSLAWSLPRTHGTGLTHKVLSTHVQALRLLLADGSSVRCSPIDHPDLFTATLCGLGSTGLILDIQYQVTAAFRLREVQESLEFDNVAERLPAIVNSAEHVASLVWPQAGVLRVSTMTKTKNVREASHIG